MAIVSDVEIRLRADIARLQQDLNRARQEVNGALGGMSQAVEKFKNVLGGLALGAAAQQIGQFVKSSIDAVDALNDMSARTKVAITDLAGLAYGAKLSDTSLEGVASSITKLSQNIGKDGAKFRELGITATEPLEAFKQLADVFKDIRDPQQRAAFGAEALGKSWQDAAVLLEGGADGIAALIGQGKELSGVTDQVAADAGAFNDKLDELGFAAQGVGTRIAAGLLPTLISIANSMDSSAVKGKELEGVVTVLAGALKGLYTVGIGVTEVFVTMGKAIGAAAAMTVQVLSGDFAAAWQTYKDLGADVAEGWTGAASRISTVWTAAGTGVVEAVSEWSEQIGGTNAKVAAFLADTAKKAADEAAKIAEETLKWYNKMREGSINHLMQLEAERDGQVELSAEEKKRIEILNEMLKRGKNLTEQQKNDIKGWAEAIPVLAKYNKFLEESRKLRAARESEAQGDVAAARAQTQALQDQITYYGLTEEAVLKLKAAEIERGIEAGFIDDIERERLQGLLEATNEQIDAQTKLSKMKSESTFWTGLEDTAKQTFLSLANGSKDIATRLKETFKNIFFDWLYQMTVKKWIINIGTSVSGTAGVSGIANAAGIPGFGDAAAGGNSAMSFVSMGKSIYDGFATGFAGVGASLGGYVAALGNTFGSASVSAFGAGMGLTSSQAATAAAAYNSAGMAGTGSAISAGSTAGAAAGALAGIAGGVYGGRFVSGGYSAFGGSGNSAVNTGTAVGAAIGSIVPVVGTALGALIGGLLGGAVNRLFGMGAKKITSEAIDGIITANGTTGNNVATWSQKGGWFRSNKSGTESGAIDAQQSSAFTATYKAILDVSKVLGDTIGADTSALAARVQKLNITLTGLSDTEKTAAVVKFFEGVADTIATELLPNLRSFQAEGETLSQTMQRVVVNFAQVKDGFTAIGKSFDFTGAKGVEVSEALIKAAGGMSALQQGLAYFEQNFVSDSDRLAAAQKQVADAMKGLGYAGVTTNAQLKALVQGLDVSSAAGSNMLIQLLAIAPAFKTVTDAVDAAAQAAAQAAAVAAEAAAQAAAQAAQVAEAARQQAVSVLAQAGNDMLAALGESIEKEKGKLAQIYQDTLDSISASVDAVSTRIGDLTRLSDILATPVVAATSAAQKGTQRDAARAQITAALAIAKASGILPSADSISAAVAAATRGTTDGFADMAGYLREQAAVGRDLAQLGGLTGDQLTTAEKTLKTLNEQKTALDLAYTNEVARLDALLVTNRDLLAAALGTNTMVYSVAGALDRLLLAVSLINAGPGANPGATQIETLYASLFGRQSDAGGLAFWLNQLNGGTSLEQIRSDFIKSPEYAGQKAEVPAESAMVLELRALNARMAAIEENTLRTSQAASSSANSSAKFANQFDQVSAGGSALLTETVK